MLISLAPSAVPDPGSIGAHSPRPSRVVGVLIVACAALSLVVGEELTGEPALASSRPYMPLTVTIAGADAIAAVRVVSGAQASSGAEGSERIRLVMLRAFKGARAETEITLVLRPYQHDLRYRFAAGSEHVVFMTPTAVRGEYRLTDETLLPHDDRRRPGSPRRSRSFPRGQRP